MVNTINKDDQSVCQISEDGTKRWTLNGLLHRKDGPAVEYTDGYKAWYLNNQYHRENGPAVECPNGYKRWFLNDQLHREDGPAVDYPNGYKAWYYHGKYIDCSSQEEFERLLNLKVLW